MTINYEQVDNVIRNIIFTINALKAANNQLESEISRLSNCNGTAENPHNHSSEIASIRKTIDNNEEKIKKLDSIWKGLTSFKDNVILKDSELAESINSPEKFAAYIAGVFSNGQIAINSKSDYDMFMNAKEFVDGMEMKIDNEIVIDEKGYNDFLNEFGYGESAGRYDVVNQYNYMGKYQIGYEALKDIGYVDYIGNDKSDDKIIWTTKSNQMGIYNKDDFLNNVNDCQEKIKFELDQKYWIYLEKNGSTKYVGKIIDDVEITESGLLAAASSAGPGGLKKALESGDLSSVKDANGVDVKYYIEKFSGYDISEITKREDE